MSILFSFLNFQKAEMKRNVKLTKKKVNLWWLNPEKKKKRWNVVISVLMMILEQRLWTAVKILWIQRSEPPNYIPSIGRFFPNCPSNGPAKFSDSLTSSKAMKQFYRKSSSNYHDRLHFRVRNYYYKKKRIIASWHTCCFPI